MIRQDGFKCFDRMVLNVVTGWYYLMWQDGFKCCDKMVLNVVTGWY